MDRLERADVHALENLIKRMDANVGIENIDYEREFVQLNYVYNSGTNMEFVEHDFYRVNTSCESVPCAIYEVVQAVFKKCVM